MMLRVSTLALLVLGLAALTTTLPGEVPCCELRYAVRPDPAARAVDVRLEIVGFEGDSLVLERPSDRPLVGLLNQDPRVEGTRGAEWTLIDGSPRWTFRRPDGGWDRTIEVTYRLAITAERPLNAWSPGLDDDLLYAPAEALFLVPDMPGLSARHAPVAVRWSLPNGWDAFTGWPGPRFYGVRTLLKTNVLAGRIHRRVASACGFRIEVGAHVGWEFDADPLAENLARLACVARGRLGEPRSDRYAVTLVQARFPVTSGNRNGPQTIGFVHSVPDSTPPSIRLLAHELVHLWQRYDAPAWFQEGVNDYMALRLAHEAGLLSDEAYAGHLSAIDSAYRAHPNRDTWSFADEHREGLEFGSSDGRLAYRKGAVVGLALDRELRLRTGGRADLSTLWREMNARARWGQVAWSDVDIASRSAALAGGSLEVFFDRFVGGTDPMPPPGALLANLPPPPPPKGNDGASGALAAFLQTAVSRIAE
ncbi:MAG: hypothetical protein R3326_00850 [Gemmatimonadota bacterium]|nr:hypothetical protein [Gemmatimonadota bacterium]